MIPQELRTKPTFKAIEANQAGAHADVCMRACVCDMVPSASTAETSSAIRNVDMCAAPLAI
jgi:hypothetical protein